MKSRGIYSMLSAFLLVIVLVFIALGLVYLNLFVLSHEEQVFEGTKPFELASDVKTKIVEGEQCFKGKITEADLVNDELFANCAAHIAAASDGQVQGFSIERMLHLDCTELVNSGGTLDACTQRVVFFTNVESSHKRCLGKMVLCMKIAESTA